MLLGGGGSAAGAETAPPPDDAVQEPLLTGVSDLHVHCFPDTRERCVDELTLARQAKAVGYRSLMLKSNDWSCHDRAYLIRQALPGFEVFGSLCLNRVHGDRVNVYAAEQAVRTTGGLCRCIWMPTLAARYQYQAMGMPDQGIPVLDAQGHVLPEVTRVMEICAEANIIFATGHSSPVESLALVRRAREVGVAKCVVTHANALYWRMTPAQVRQAVDWGAFVEYCYLPRLWGPGTGNPQFERQSRQAFLDYVTLVPERSFISTDLGQFGNPHPIAGMRQCLRELAESGMSQRTIDLMVRGNPAHLMGLDA